MVYIATVKFNYVADLIILGHKLSSLDGTIYLTDKYNNTLKITERCYTCEGIDLKDVCTLRLEVSDTVNIRKINKLIDFIEGYSVKEVCTV